MSLNQFLTVFTKIPLVISQIHHILSKKLLYFECVLLGLPIFSLLFQNLLLKWFQNKFVLIWSKHPGTESLYQRMNPFQCLLLPPLLFKNPTQEIIRGKRKPLLRLLSKLLKKENFFLLSFNPPSPYELDLFIHTIHWEKTYKCSIPKPFMYKLPKPTTPHVSSNKFTAKNLSKSPSL